MSMFTKILIANRGEIACRVIDTCRELNVKTVAVFSDADRASRHVSMADEAVHIGSSSVAESYLVASRIIEAAKATGAEAIHPGFGFLSENPEFVEAVEAAGLTFIGPSAKSIRAMGLKDAAKALMEAANVPVVPGYHGDNQDADFLANEAEKIGYPVLIKARAGGGGKGMRLVERAEDFAEALESAAREGLASFGDGMVLVEKYINAPRHIEVQVFGDSHGDVVHLYERDCSLQRRHQKVIEEAPAPGMTDEMRAAMTSAAVTAAKAIDYEGAGTIEFIVDGAKMSADGFWFMEMNTRLQVEHPVTEEVTGFDLVEWQLRVASGEPLPVKQEHITLMDHSFEARLYAEDPANDFLPETGTLTHLHFPDDARIETGVREGDTITAHYDPMIAKIITHGETRDEALKNLLSALQETQVMGCVTNVDFLAQLAAHEGFVRGEVDTGLITRDLEALTKAIVPTLQHDVIACLCVFGALDSEEGLGAWQLWGAPSRLVDVNRMGETIAARVSQLKQDCFQILFDDQTIEIERMDDTEDGRFRFMMDRRQFAADIIVDEQSARIVIDGESVDYILQKSYDGGNDNAFASNQIVAPMPGVITTCNVSVGDVVKSGDTLLVMEAMKMEHALEATIDGVVESADVAVGEQVEKGSILIVLSEAE